MGGTALDGDAATRPRRKRKNDEEKQEAEDMDAVLESLKHSLVFVLGTKSSLGYSADYVKKLLQIGARTGFAMNRW